MAIKYLPSELLKEMAPEKIIRRMVTKNMTLNAAALKSLARVSGLPKKQLEKIALRVIREYKKSMKAKVAEGLSKKAALDETLNNKVKMVQRVQDHAVNEVAAEIKEHYKGEKYRWLPSSAKVPDPEHQLLYWTVRTIGKGEMPGDRRGCQCGMEILVNETELFQAEEEA